MINEKKLSRSRSLAAKLIYAALSILRDNGKEMVMRELMSRIDKQVKLEEWDKERYEKSGYIRWESILHFFSIDSVKAGYLIKKKGIWYLTPEGEEALSLEPIKMLNSATKAYRKWRAEHPSEQTVSENEEADTEDQTITFDEVEQIAMEGLERYINKKNPYECRDLVAALLRGMGYYTPFVALWL